MEDTKYELEISEVKSEKDIVDNQTNADTLNSSGSETDSIEDVVEINETHVGVVQKDNSLVSTKEIQPEAMKILHVRMNYPSSESNENQKYGPCMSPSRKSEFDKTCESEVKSEKDIVDNQTNTDNSSYSALDTLNGSGSETDSIEDVEEINETNAGVVQKDNSLVSTTEEIQPGAMKILHVGINYRSLESKADKNHKDFVDEHENNKSRSTKFKSFVDVHQTKLYESHKYDSPMSSSSKSEFDNKTCESSKVDVKVIKNIDKDNVLSKYLTNSGEGASFNSPRTGKNLKAVNDECFSGNFTKESAPAKSEQVQTTLGTLNLESTAEDIDACLNEYLRKLKPNLTLFMSALKESKSDKGNEWKEFPQDIYRNITVPVYEDSILTVNNLSQENRKDIADEPTVLERELNAFGNRTAQLSRLAGERSDEINLYRAKTDQNNQTLKQKFSEIEHWNATHYTDVYKNEHRHENEIESKTEKQNTEVSFKFHRPAKKDDARYASEQQELEVLHDEKHNSGLERSVIQPDGKTMQLSENILMGRSSQTYDMQSTTSSKCSENTGRGQSGMVRGVRLKNGAIPDKIIPGKVKNRESRISSRSKAEVRPGNVLHNPGNRAAGHEKPVAANKTRLLESNITDTGLTDISKNKDLREVNVPQNVRFCPSVSGNDERMYEEFTKISGTLSNDSKYTKEKCKDFIRDLDILDTEIRVNPEKLLNIQIKEVKSMYNNNKFDKGEKKLKFLNVVSAFRSTYIVTKPCLKDKLRENIDSLYESNSTLYRYFEIIRDKLRVIDEGIVIKGSKEKRLKKVIAEYVVEIEKLNTLTFRIDKYIKLLEKFFINIRENI